MNVQDETTLHALAKVTPQQVVAIAGPFERWRTLRPSPGQAVDWLAIEAAFPHWVRAMRACPQEPDYHAEGDVWTHVRMVVESLLGFADYQALPDQDQEALFWAALLHDEGKPATTRRDPVSGRITSRGHSRRGAQDVRATLWYAGAPRVLRETVARWMVYHQAPFVWVNREDRFELREWSQGMRLDHLALLARADAMGRRTNPVGEQINILERVDLFQMACEEEACWSRPWSFPFEHRHAERLYWEARGEQPPDRPVQPSQGSDVVVLSGLPASGKDTWCQRWAGDRPVVSFDDAREHFNVRQNQAQGTAIRWATGQAREHLRAGAPFVWNATHLSPTTRERTLNLLRQYGAVVRLVHLEADPSTLFRRNTARDTSLTNTGIEKMVWKWEPPWPTEAHETMGWDAQGPWHHVPLTTPPDPSSPWLTPSPAMDRRPRSRLR